MILKSLYEEGQTSEAILSLYGRCFKVDIGHHCERYVYIRSYTVDSVQDLAEAHRNAPVMRQKYLQQVGTDVTSNFH